MLKKVSKPKKTEFQLAESLEDTAREGYAAVFI
ncbi:hypothetical protein Ga0466249_000416 [Sporomusaceae bacterium BoRhaA]|nr:hypothetical protein [Pelorhabdus rhamnosifermentans]